MFPEFVIHAGERVARDDSHRDLVGQFLRLKVRVVCEDPHVAQLVRHRRVELLGTQSREEATFNRKTKWLMALLGRFDRDDQRDLRLDRDAHALGDAKFVSQSIDNQLDPLEDER